MYLMTFNVDGCQWAHRTQVFTGTTADAHSLVDGRNRGRQVVVRIRGHHLDGSCRTMAGAVAAFRLALGGDTEVGSYYSMTNLDT